MQRKVIYECVGLRTEYNGGLKIQATNYLMQYLEAGWQVVNVGGGGAVQPAFQAEPSQFVIFAIVLEKP